MINRDQLEERLAVVRAELAGIGRDEIKIIAVTKGFPASVVELARAAGLDDIGESYAQDLLEKVDSYTGATLHFIGRIQRNKVRKVADVVDLWHSVDRVEILDEIAKRSEGARVLLQVNPVENPTKAGVDPAEVPEMLDRASSLGLIVEGLMTIGIQDDPSGSRTAFAAVDRLADEYGLAERSMGMSADYMDAAAAGSTMIRLGTSLFGPRTRVV